MKMMYGKGYKMIKRRTIVHDQQNLVNGKWKLFCAALALMYAGNVVAMDTSSPNNLRRSNSRTQVTSSNSSLPSVSGNSKSNNTQIRKRYQSAEERNLQDQKNKPVFKENGLKQLTKEELRTELISYIESDDIEGIENMINSTVSFGDIVNLPDNKTGHTPLWVAIRKNPKVKITGPNLFDIKVDKSPVKISLDIVELLLKNGADANSISLQELLSSTTSVDVGIGIPMLTESTISEDDKLETIKLLLQYGANPMFKEEGWNSSLIEAIDNIKDKEIRYEICKMLLEKKPDVVNLKGFRNRTPYMYADYKKDQRVMNLLEEYGADIYIDPKEDMDWQ